MASSQGWNHGNDNKEEAVTQQAPAVNWDQVAKYASKMADKDHECTCDKCGCIINGSAMTCSCQKEKIYTTKN